MAVTSFKTSSMTTGSKRARVWDQSSSPGNFYSIATNTVGVGGTSNIIFSDIPQIYTHLQIRITSRSTNASTLSWSNLRINSDTTNANYKGHQLYGDGSSAASGVFGSSSGIAAFLTTGSTATANIFGTAIIDILDYTNTNKYKTIKVMQGSDSNGSGYVILHSGAWLSTSSITSLNFLDTNGGNYAQYSSFALYGVL